MIYRIDDDDTVSEEVVEKQTKQTPQATPIDLLIRSLILWMPAEKGWRG